MVGMFCSTTLNKAYPFLNIIKMRKDVGNVDHKKEKLCDFIT